LVGIPFRYEVDYSCKTKADEILRIVELNANRRHMTPAQRAQLVLRAKPELEKLAKENMSKGGKGVRIQTPLGRVDEQLAKRAHTTKGMINTMDKIIKAAEENPNRELGLDYDGRYRGHGGPTYARLLQDVLRNDDKALPPSKACSIIKRDNEVLRKRAEASDSAKSLRLPDRVLLLNADSTKFEEEIPELKDDSLDLIITDPPYIDGSLPLYEALAKMASTKLKEGGSIVFFYGNLMEPEIHKLFAKYENLTWWWRFCVYHEGAHNSRMHIRGVRVDWKPVMWFVKGNTKLPVRDIDDFIKSTKPDKSKHPWAQIQTEAEFLINNLTVSENSLVVDPFLGSGAFVIPAIKLGRYVIGIEKDKHHFENAKNYVLNETVKKITSS
jgi:DNA modification methylase